MSLISVVIPAYNREKTIVRAIESVLSMNMSNIEIIVVDDGSSDNTFQAVLTMARGESQITCLRHETNRGAQAARNTGAKAVQSEWICFLDSDDYFLPGSIAKRLDAARKTGAQVVHSECIVIRSNNHELFGIPPMEGIIYKDVLSRPGPMFQAMLIQTQALEMIGYLDEAIESYQEWDSSIRLAERFKFAFVPEPTFVYDCRGSDTISRDMLRDVNGYKQVIRKHRKAILQHCGHGAMAEHCNQVANRYKHLGMRKEYLEYLTKALVAQPSRGVGLMKRIVSRARSIAMPVPNMQE